MSKWAGKYVIGLTGNIGTGKSVVRRMLEHLGAYGIDADTLGHRAIARGAPGYQPIVTYFGRYVLAPSGEVDRARLGRIVFSDLDALDALEKIVHPLVEQAVDLIVQRAIQPVVVIEAIKLIETAGLVRACDSVWVTTTSPETQLERLMKYRKISDSEARQRIAAQPPQQQKIYAAQVVIKNDGLFEETWRQVVSGWKRFVPVAPADSGPVAVTAPLPGASTPVVAGTQPSPLPQHEELSILRARPRHSVVIAEIMNRTRKPLKPIQASDIMAAFGEKAFLLLQSGRSSMGVIGWQVENLVARTTDILIDPTIPMEQALPILVIEMEKASRDLQCEASLIFAPPELARHEAIWKKLGYEIRLPQSLSVLAWQEAAQESAQTGTALLFKQLRVDRVLRPI